MNESQPYAFAFDTKSKPGVLIAHCVRFETIEVPTSESNREFRMFGSDINNDFRQAQFLTTVKSILAQ